MQLGLPVITTNVGAVNEMITENENGIVVGLNVDSIFGGIQRIIQDKEQLEVMGNNSLEIYSKMFSKDIWINNMVMAFDC